MIGLPNLQWFPKPFTAGDTDGAGLRRVLGQPEVDLQSLLVRETAQNSWDAARDLGIPLFEIRLRELGPEVRDVLRWNVFGNRAAPDLGLLEALDRPQLFATEIVDRGTSGLGGPTRNDLEPPEGAPTDYADFVLTVGAPPDHAHGGGTYGFGKTASYLASQVFTVVIWSRFRDHQTQELRERFIASAMGPSFTIGSQKHTGRQWWGVPCTDDGPLRFDPAVDDDARTLGSHVFERGFHGDETGTSLLILHPRFEDDDDADRTVDRWRAAILGNLWPKLNPDQAEERRMSARLYLGGEEVALPTMDSSPLWRAKHDCLNAVRNEQAHMPQPSGSSVKIVQIRTQKPPRLLGHLALLRLATPTDDPMVDTADTVTYMRNRAELVVRAQAFGSFPVAGVNWVGVFKPTASEDHAFAQSEPPAHDNWSPDAVQDKAQRRSVNVALREIKAAVNEFVSPRKASRESSGSSSTGAVSMALAALTGSAAGGVATPQPRPHSYSGPSRTSPPKVRAISAQPLQPSADSIRAGRQWSRVQLELTNATQATVRPSALKLAVDGGSMGQDGSVELTGWQLANGEVTTAPAVQVRAGEAISALISYPAGLAIEVSFIAEVL